MKKFLVTVLLGMLISGCAEDAADLVTVIIKTRHSGSDYFYSDFKLYEDDELFDVLSEGSQDEYELKDGATLTAKYTKTTVSSTGTIRTYREEDEEVAREGLVWSVY